MPSAEYPPSQYSFPLLQTTFPLNQAMGKLLQYLICPLVEQVAELEELLLADQQ